MFPFVSIKNVESADENYCHFIVKKWFRQNKYSLDIHICCRWCKYNRHWFASSRVSGVIFFFRVTRFQLQVKHFCIFRDMFTVSQGVTENSFYTYFIWFMLTFSLLSLSFPPSNNDNNGKSKTDETSSGNWPSFSAAQTRCVSSKVVQWKNQSAWM